MTCSAVGQILDVTLIRKVLGRRALQYALLFVPTKELTDETAAERLHLYRSARCQQTVFCISRVQVLRSGSWQNSYNGRRPKYCRCAYCLIDSYVALAHHTVLRECCSAYLRARQCSATCTIQAKSLLCRHKQ